MNLEKEKSYMLAVPFDSEEILDIESIIGRLYGSKDFKLIDIHNNDGSMEINVEYKGYVYDACFYPTTYELPELYRSLHLFKDIDIEKLENSEEGIAIEMMFGKSALDSYHLQLKIINTILPETVGILDDSSEKILSGRWVKLAAESSVPPAPRYVFTTQAISGEEGESVWLHTHGLGRCGITEIEMINSTKESYNDHYSVIETIANRLLDSDIPLSPREPIYIGRLTEQVSLVCTLIPWEEAVENYDENMLGGKVDRKQGHNHNTSAIFVYCSEDDYQQGKYTELSVYDDVLCENPIFYLTNRETERMSQLARERIFFAINGFNQEENKVIVKIALEIDDEHKEDNNTKEHIWFELKGFKNNILTAELTQEPYYVSNMHVGDVADFTVDQVTDWLIYTPQQRFSPDEVYLMI